MSYGTVFFLAAAAVLLYSYRRASTTILRQQLKWVTRGTILAIIPYSVLYVVPYLMGSLPDAAMKISALSLALLPLTFGSVSYTHLRPTTTPRRMKKHGSTHHARTVDRR